MFWNKKHDVGDERWFCRQTLNSENTEVTIKFVKCMVKSSGKNKSLVAIGEDESYVDNSRLYTCLRALKNDMKITKTNSEINSEWIKRYA